MCKLCSIEPVYEFTNQRKLCDKCFIRWFEKKVLYIIRKFRMIKRGEVVCIQSGDGFREAVLKKVLEMFAEKVDVKLVKSRFENKKNKKGSNGMEPNRLILNDSYNKSKYLNVSISLNNGCAGMAEWLTQLTDTQRPFGLVGSIPTPSAARLKINKFAVPDTLDLISNKIIENIIEKDINNIKKLKPVECKIIRPLYLFLDKEVLLYAKLNNLKFRKLKEKKNEIGKFINSLEFKHPEIKNAVVKGVLKTYDN